MPTYHSASGSSAEDLFIELFSETFGAEKAGYLYSQYHFYDIYQNSRYADFVLENGSRRVAIEIDDEASHNPKLVSQNKFYDDLLKQNSMVYLGWDVYRWAVRQMQIQPEAVKDELQVFLGSHPQFREIEDYLPQQRGKAFDGSQLELKKHQLEALKSLQAMLYHEFLALMDTRLAAAEPVLHAKPEFNFVGFSYWETRYLQSLSLLTKAPASMGGEKEARYQTLVEKARLSYASYDGPPDGKNPRLSWCNVCQEINLWTYWQGRGNLNAPILLVGQDWGCLRTKDGEACIRKIQLAPDGPIPNYMTENDNPTDKNLVRLFQEALSISIERPNSNVFFTNFVLGYRNEGTSGGFKPDWVRHDKDYFRELAEIIEPQVILCLGRNTFEGVLTSFSKQVQIGAFNHFIESDQNPVSVVLNSGKTAYVFALAHCGVMGTLNRNQGKDTSLNTQIQDWKRIRPYLEGVVHADSIT